MGTFSDLRAKFDPDDNRLRGKQFEYVDEKARVKLSAEVRLLEGSIGRLLKLINTTPVIESAPPPRSVYYEQASRHGRKAAESRWRRASAV